MGTGFFLGCATFGREKRGTPIQGGDGFGLYVFVYFGRGTKKKLTRWVFSWPGRAIGGFSPTGLENFKVFYFTGRYIHKLCIFGAGDNIPVRAPVEPSGWPLFRGAKQAFLREPLFLHPNKKTKFWLRGPLRFHGADRKKKGNVPHI